MKEFDEKIKLISSIFRESVHFDNKEIEALSGLMKLLEIKKGGLLVKHGDIVKSIYLVKSGLLRQFYLKEGRDISEHFASEGQGLMCIKSMFENRPSEMMIEALENSIVYTLPYYELIKLADTYPAFHTFIRKSHEYSLILSQEKADSWRFEKSSERYNRFLREFPEVAKRASIQHIASYLLMTPESLSRVRAGNL